MDPNTQKITRNLRGTALPSVNALCKALGVGDGTGRHQAELTYKTIAWRKTHGTSMPVSLEELGNWKISHSHILDQLASGFFEHYKYSFWSRGALQLHHLVPDHSQDADK